MNKKAICPQCGATAIKVTFKNKFIGAVAKTVLCVDPAPTTCVGKAENVYHCPNCGHEWPE